MEKCEHEYSWTDQRGNEFCFQCEALVRIAKEKVVLTVIQGGKNEST